MHLVGISNYHHKILICHKICIKLNIFLSIKTRLQTERVRIRILVITTLLVGFGSGLSTRIIPLAEKMCFFLLLTKLLRSWIRISGSASPNIKAGVCWHFIQLYLFFLQLMYNKIRINLFSSIFISFYFNHNTYIKYCPCIKKNKYLQK